MPDLIITGVPRSGTTLAAAIIDQSADALCLSEPEGHVDLMREAVSSEDFVAKLSQEFDVVRRTVLDGGAVVDRRRADGAPVTDYFSDLRPDGRREKAFTIRTIRRPGLSPDCVLGVKHNALYTAVLPEIVRSGRFRVVAIVRDPADVLMSWRTLDLPVSRGRLPAGERFWPELAALGRADLDLTDKQIRICDLLLSRFEELADQIAVVPYEVFVVDKTRLLAAAGINKAPAARSSVHIRPSYIDDRQREELTERIRRLTAIGQLPGIARYYPQYGPAVPLPVGGLHPG
jgi:Sulfotransferase domain